MKCDTVSGKYTCKYDNGHDGECEYDTDEYAKLALNETSARQAAVRALQFADREIDNLKKVRDAALALIGTPEGSVRFRERMSALMRALGDSE